MGRRIPCIDGDEQDVFSPWRHFVALWSRPGATSAVKRRYRRRERHEAKRQFWWGHE